MTPSETLKAAGWFAFQRTDGDWEIRDQGNEIPELLWGMGPWPTAEDAIAAAENMLADDAD